MVAEDVERVEVRHESGRFVKALRESNCSTHHHHSGAPLLQFLHPVVATRTKIVVPLVDHTVCMSLAVVAPANLVIVVAQHDATRCAAEAFRMKFQTSVGLKVLTLYATVASPAKRTIQLVIMLFTVGKIVEDVKFRGRKGSATRPANEALLVISTCEATRRVLDRLANDLLRAAPASAFAGRRRSMVHITL